MRLRVSGAAAAVVVLGRTGDPGRGLLCLLNKAAARRSPYSQTEANPACSAWHGRMHESPNETHP